MKSISKFEYGSCLFLISQALFLGFGITSIIKNTGNAAWICVLIGSCIGLIINYIFSKLPSSNNKYLSFITNAALLLYSCLIISNIISLYYLDKTPVYLIMLPLLFLIYYISKKNITIIFTVISVLLLINIIFYLLTTVSVPNLFNFDNLLPIADSSIKNILLSSLNYALLSCLPYTIMPLFKKKYNYKFYLLSSLFLLLIFIIIIGVLGPKWASVYQFPEYVILKRVSILNFVENIENILFNMWIITIFVLSIISGSNLRFICTNKIFIITLSIIYSLGLIIFNKNYINFIYSHFIIIAIIIIIIYLISKLKIKK